MKLAVLLGACSPVEAELIGGLVGLALVGRIAGAGGGKPRVRWLTDSLRAVRIIEDLAGGGVNDKNAAGWGAEAFRAVISGVELEVEHIRAHCGDRRNEACDRACRWVRTKGEKLLSELGEGRVGRNRKNPSTNCWYLVDGRRLEELVHAGQGAAVAVEVGSYLLRGAGADGEAQVVAKLGTEISCRRCLPAAD